jgi:hypothetical protein
MAGLVYNVQRGLGQIVELKEFYTKNHSFFVSRAVDTEDLFVKVLTELIPTHLENVLTVTFTLAFSYNALLNSAKGYVVHVSGDCDFEKVFHSEYAMGATFIYAFHSAHSTIQSESSELMERIAMGLSEQNLWPSLTGNGNADGNSIIYTPDDCVISLHSIKSLKPKDTSTGYFLLVSTCLQKTRTDAFCLSDAASVTPVLEIQNQVHDAVTRAFNQKPANFQLVWSMNNSSVVRTGTGYACYVGCAPNENTKLRCFSRCPITDTLHHIYDQTLSISNQPTSLDTKESHQKFIDSVFNTISGAVSMYTFPTLPYGTLQSEQSNFVEKTWHDSSSINSSLARLVNTFYDRMLEFPVDCISPISGPVARVEYRCVAKLQPFPLKGLLQQDIQALRPFFHKFQVDLQINVSNLQIVSTLLTRIIELGTLDPTNSAASRFKFVITDHLGRVYKSKKHPESNNKKENEMQDDDEEEEEEEEEEEFRNLFYVFPWKTLA